MCTLEVFEKKIIGDFVFEEVCQSPYSRGFLTDGADERT